MQPTGQARSISMLWYGQTCKFILVTKHSRKLGSGYSSSRTALSSTPRSRLTISSCFRRLVLIPFTAVTRSPAQRASQRCATLPGRRLLMLGHRPLSTPPKGNNSHLSVLYLQFTIFTRTSNSIQRRMASSGMLRRVALVKTDVSEELSASFIRVTRIGELGTTLMCIGC
jgi:hypothetical protein